MKKRNLTAGAFRPIVVKVVGLYGPDYTRDLISRFVPEGYPPKVVHVKQRRALWAALHNAWNKRRPHFWTQCL